MSPVNKEKIQNKTGKKREKETKKNNGLPSPNSILYILQYNTQA
jgi:hypothetical protein